jgi:hypothetical protein
MRERSQLALALVVTGLVASACHKTSEPAERDAPGKAASASGAATGSAAASAAPVTLGPRISRPAAARVVAIGDLHGDLDHARRAFTLAGAIGPDGHWSGGSLVVVQTGDEIDRGDDDRAILDQVDVWKREAKAAGGELIALDGNHELMNAALDFRYVTPGGFAAFADQASNAPASVLAQIPPELPAVQRGRAAAFAPGGSYAKILAERPIFVKVGDTLFVHGGVLPAQVDFGLGALDEGVRDWLLAKRSQPPKLALAEDGPVWSRVYSDPGHEDCARLATAESRLGIARMVVGHTVQKDGVTSACGQHVWRIDVGMSRAYGGPIQVLEIAGGHVRTLREGGPDGGT